MTSLGRSGTRAAMREVIYQPLPAPGPGPLPLESRPLDEFVLDRPYLLADTIVPLPVLNSVFAGGRLDAGMSRGAAWDPFEIAQEEHRELVDYFPGPDRTFTHVGLLAARPSCWTRM